MKTNKDTAVPMIIGKSAKTRAMKKRNKRNIELFTLHLY